MKIPQDVKKQDLYDFVSRLYNTKLKEVTAAAQIKLDKLTTPDELLVDLLPKARKIDGELWNIKRFLEVYLTPEMKTYMGGGNAFYHMKELKKYLPSLSVEHNVTRYIKENFKNVNIHTKSINETDSPLEVKLKEEYNAIIKEYKAEKDKLVGLKSELDGLIKAAGRGKDAWETLEKVGLDLSELRKQLTSGVVVGLPSVITVTHDIGLFNSVINKNNKE